MDVEPVQLEDKHYRAVKAIFRDTFDRTIFNIKHINTSWHNRSKEESYGFILNGNLIGFIITSYHVKNKDNLYIDYIAFHKDYRGRGLGTDVLKDMLKGFKEVNRSVHLYPERSELWSWYERLGFQKTHDGYMNFHSYETRSKTK
jgi:ribosomal protein S18 acetylase RimI-like enzyme|uniref:N-acetyltransferase domain-containing protein n=1 Tax=viral metagenome TaxID=1070528 RepID=A0A6C0DM14_9ZZZZ